MNIHVNWGSADRSAIHLIFERGWTWEHLKQAIQQADDMIHGVEHTVHLIIDIRNGGGIPRDFLSAANEVFAQGEARTNEGQRIVIGAGMLIRAAYRSLLAIYGAQMADRPFLFAADMDEAQQMIAAS